MPTSLELECHISVTANRTCRMQLVHTASSKSYRTHVNRFYEKIMQTLCTVSSKFDILLMEQQFVITHTICQTEIPGLLDSWVTNTPSVKMLSIKILHVLTFL
jgi:hypothetical protein